MRIAIAQLTVSSGITDGASGPEHMFFIPATRRLNITGTPDDYSFFNEIGKPVSLVIKGQMSFDLDNDVQKHNWELLSVLMQLPHHEDMREHISLIDPTADAVKQRERDAKELKLRQIINRHETDEEWLRSVYRRVVGPASGIPLIAMAVALSNKAKEGPEAKDLSGKFGIDHFLTVDGKWIFEDEYFETRSLLGLAIERSVLIKDGETYKLKSDPSKVAAHDEANMLYKLQNDASLRSFVFDQCNRQTPQRDRPTSYQTENSELVRLAGGLGASGVKKAGTDSLTPVATDGSFANTEMQELVAKFTESTLITEEDGLFTIEEVPVKFSSVGEIIDYLNTNPQTVSTLKALL